MHLKVDYAPPELDENDWKLQPDNEFALTLHASIENNHPSHDPNINLTLALCARCQEFREQLWSPGFSMVYDVASLRASTKTGACELCALLWKTAYRNGTVASPTIRFERTGPFLKLRGSGPPVLSIIRSPRQQSYSTSDCQISFVELPEPGTPIHFGVLRHWLNDCDRHHSCQPMPAEGVADRAPRRIPTRLIRVGQPGDHSVRLWETTSADTGEWIALSHKWGDRHFSTTPDNLADHIRGLNVSTLPATFRDAVTVTRALGCQYLWIDSLCVIQGPGGDFKTEAKRMEDVYSGAYCVIAASCADDHYSGFLERRRSRDSVGMRQAGRGYPPFYICETIDNFKEHVLDGALYRRGWVLQEHALARRTIFFTEHQTYFECGRGVRCETATKMTK